MERTELRRADGEVFLIVERPADNSYILAHWIARQTLDTVRKGGTYYVRMLQKQPCSKLLNSHAELIGPWDIANVFSSAAPED
jgi:hypothetical protein